MTQKIPIDKIDKALTNSNKTKKKKGKKLAIILSIVSVLLIGLVIGGIYGYNKFFNVPNVIIPQLVGLTEDQAKQILAEHKLTVIEGASQSSDKPAGVVLNVTPLENSIVKENSAVTLILSSGAAKVTIPDLSGKSESDAELTLSDAKLIKGTVQHRNNDNVPKGQIISLSQDPAAGESVDAGSSVSFVISDGPLIKMLTVPELIGKSQAEAVQALSDAHIKLGKVNYEQNVNFIDDVVTGQSVPGDSQIPENETIDITINKSSSTDNQNQSNTTNSPSTTPQNNMINTTPKSQTTNPPATTP